MPVNAVLLGVTLLGEHIDARQATGMALIAAGLAVVDGRLPRSRAPQALRALGSAKLDRGRRASATMRHGRLADRPRSLGRAGCPDGGTHGHGLPVPVRGRRLPAP